MIIEKNYSLKKLNAFKLDVKAKYFALIKDKHELHKVLKKHGEEPIFILGDGYNTLFTKDFDGLILKICIKGIKVTEETNKDVVLEVGAGENWNGLVQYAVNNGYAGIENLTLVPGSVGAAPVQNIACYGQNFEDVFESLNAYVIKENKIKTFSKTECKFSYRSSLFKEQKGDFIVLSVKIKLGKNEEINTTYHSRYGSIMDELKKFSKKPYNIRDVSKAIARIRERKFPDWEKTGTAGSFFLNPIISKRELKIIKKKAPGVQYYPVDKLTYLNPDDPKFDFSKHVKVAAGWLLEELGWKGKIIGKVGTSPNQSLVVINYGTKKAEDILKFTNKMQKDFYKAYKIKLEPEVNIV